MYLSQMPSLSVCPFVLTSSQKAICQPTDRPAQKLGAPEATGLSVYTDVHYVHSLYTMYTLSLYTPLTVHYHCIVFALVFVFVIFIVMHVFCHCKKSNENPFPFQKIQKPVFKLPQAPRFDRL